MLKVLERYNCRRQKRKSGAFPRRREEAPRVFEPSSSSKDTASAAESILASNVPFVTLIPPPSPTDTPPTPTANAFRTSTSPCRYGSNGGSVHPGYMCPLNVANTACSSCAMQLGLVWLQTACQNKPKTAFRAVSPSGGFVFRHGVCEC